MTSSAPHRMQATLGKSRLKAAMTGYNSVMPMTCHEHGKMSRQTPPLAAFVFDLINAEGYGTDRVCGTLMWESSVSEVWRSSIRRTQRPDDLCRSEHFGTVAV